MTEKELIITNTLENIKIDTLENIKIDTSENIKIDTLENINDKKKQTKGLKRNTIDKYYTKLNIVEQCIILIRTYININNSDLIIEPGAGNGSFIEYIKKISDNYIFYDLEPEHIDIIKQNFLIINHEELIDKFNNIHIIGNPPFGRQSSMAIKFIKKCCLFAKSISFILPKSFKKDSMKKHFNEHYHLVNQIDLPENSFLVNEEESNVPCVFQIWKFKEEVRNKIEKYIPLHFIFTKKENNPDISFRRVGINAGVISLDISNKSFQSHYFIKFINESPLSENINKLKSLTFNYNNTVGPKSISKQELIYEFNRCLK